MAIRLWMRTAVRKDVTSFGTFLSTLCHEFCHHLDFATTSISSGSGSVKWESAEVVAVQVGDEDSLNAGGEGQITRDRNRARQAVGY